MIPNPQDIEPAAVSHSLGTRFRYTISDVCFLAQRELLHWRGQPGVIIINWLFPVLMVLMFGLLFGGAIVVPDGGAYFEFLMPGMYAMTMLFGVESTVMAVTSDASKGVTDRFRSMPMNASAVVIGRCAADMLNSVIGLAVLIASGLLLGWRWHDGLGNALLAVLLLLLLRFALLWVGIYIGLIAKSPHIVSTVQLLVWPVGFLSNVFVDPSTMPAWLGAIAEWNPLSATSSSARELFLNPGWQGNSWMSEHSVMLSIVWPIALIAIFLPMSVRRYRQLSR